MQGCKTAELRSWSFGRGLRVKAVASTEDETKVFVLPKLPPRCALSNLAQNSVFSFSGINLTTGTQFSVVVHWRSGFG